MLCLLGSLLEIVASHAPANFSILWEAFPFHFQSRAKPEVSGYQSESHLLAPIAKESKLKIRRGGGHLAS